MSKKYKTGTVGEIRFQQEMLKMDFDVFANVCGQGPIDQVVVNPETGKCAYVDVKSISTPYYRGDNRKAIYFGNQLGHRNGIWYVGYVHSEDEFYFPEGFFESLHSSSDS